MRRITILRDSVLLKLLRIEIEVQALSDDGPMAFEHVFEIVHDRTSLMPRFMDGNGDAGKGSQSSGRIIHFWHIS